MDDIDREVQLAHDRLLKTLEQANAAGVISDEALRRAVREVEQRRQESQARSDRWKEEGRQRREEIKAWERRVEARKREVRDLLAQLPPDVRADREEKSKDDLA
jgi:predicted RNase H-like nuclease (RuvC/YqgF family)